MIPATVLILGATLGLLLALTGVALRYRDSQGAEVFALLEAVSAVWVGVTIVGLSTPPGELRVRLWGLSSGLSLVVAVLWLGFILSYTGREEWLRPRRLGVVGLPLLVGGGLYALAPRWTLLAGDLSQQVIPAGTVVASSIGPLGSVLGVYIYAVFLAGLGIVLTTVLTGPRLFVGQALAFIAGSLVTIVASVLVVVGVAPDGYPLTQVALGTQSLAFGYAVLGQELLQVVPATAKIGERAVVTDLDDGVLVVDDHGVVVRTNPAARAILGDRANPGDAVDAALEIMDVATVDDLPTRFEHDGRVFQADDSRIRNWQGDPVGTAVVVRDVTELVTREQRLEVLNRVLRHNVRNEMTVVKGVGEQLQTAHDAGIQRQGERVSESAADLLQVTEKAIEIDELVDRSADATAVDLSEAMSDVVAPLAESHPEASVESTADVGTLHTDRVLLTSVLEQVVSNGLEHAGDAPTVEIDAERRDGGVAITVADDGSGIPQPELEPVRRGTVTDLSHASSFGLWFIYWGTNALDGTVDVTATDAGTEVTLIVPDGRPADEDVSVAGLSDATFAD